MFLSTFFAKFVKNPISIGDRIDRLFKYGEEVSPISNEAEGIKVVQEVCKEILQPLIATTVSVVQGDGIDNESFDIVAKYFYLVSHLGFKKQLKDKTRKGDRFQVIAKKAYDEELCAQYIKNDFPSTTKGGSGKNSVVKVAVWSICNNMFYYCGKNERVATLDMIMEAFRSELDENNRILGGQHYANS